MTSDITGPIEITDESVLMFTPHRTEYRFDPRVRPHKIVFDGNDPQTRGLPEFAIITDGDEHPAVVVDRARFERVLTIAAAACEWANAPYNHETEDGGEVWAAAESALTRATMTLQSGDLDPLPQPAHDSPSPSS